ncbi:hypothetical protein PMAYCL1PPCAC_04077, partial [Pristionchus mayeri]
GILKTHFAFRITTATLFCGLFAIIVSQTAVTHTVDDSDHLHLHSQILTGCNHCLHVHSRLFDAEVDEMVNFASYIVITIGNALAVAGCFYDDLLWLSILTYHVTFLVTVSSTIGQGLSGYAERCLSLFTFYFVAHIGMGMDQFLLHILFIYTHRGLTFYQWIPLKLGRLYQKFTGNTQPDHLIQRYRGLKCAKTYCESAPLLEEDQANFADSDKKLIEKTCIE